MIAGLLGVIALLGMLVWRFPLERVVRTQIPGLEAAAVTGTIWDGRVLGARYQGVALGDVDVGLIPGSVLGGTPQVRFHRLQGPVSGRILLSRDISRVEGPLLGRVAISRDVRRVEGVTGELALPLGRTGLAARVELADVMLETDLRGRCRAVAGQVRATLAGVPIMGDTPPLAGEPRCDGPAIRVPMALADGSMGLDLRLQPDRRWDAELSVRAANPLLRTMLATAGFAVGPDRATLAFSGTTTGAAPG
jgi:general secretion pathway protein N